MRPARMRSKVVLPAPFGPATATIAPARRVRSTPRSTCAAPNARRTPVARRSTAPSGSATSPAVRAPSEDGIDARPQLLETERFDDVAGVRKVEKLELRLDTHVRRRDDDRQIGMAHPDASQELH